MKSMFSNRPRRSLSLRKTDVELWRFSCLVGAGALLSSCVVWKEDYDVLAAKQRDEAAAHRAAQTELSKSREEVLSLQAKMEQMERQLTDSQRRLDAHAESLAQAEFEYGVVDQQKQEATQLVEQLRAEMERLAAHFQAYASDREELTAERERLSQELESAEVRLKALAVAQERAQQRLEMVRDLSLRLRKEIDREEVSLLFDGDLVVLRLDSKRVFEKNALTAHGKRLLTSVGKALIDAPREVPKQSSKDKSKRATDNAEQTVNNAEPTVNNAPRLVINQWDEGQRQQMSQARLKLLRDALSSAGMTDARLANQAALVEYKNNVRLALEKPKTLQPSAVPLIAADRETRALALSAQTSAKEWAAPGQALTLHLVPLN